MYKIATKFLQRFFKIATIYKHGFNWSPMYRRSTAKLIAVSDDLHYVKIRLKLNWKNRNYAGSIFGGSMLSATDPIYMIQLMQILDNNYVVWDKNATIKYKRPAKETVYSEFHFSEDEIEGIKNQVAKNGEEGLRQALKYNPDIILLDIFFYCRSKYHFCISQNYLNTS